MTAKATIQHIRDKLYLIQLPLAVPGFNGFIGAWVHTAHPAAIIDVGPATTAPLLLEALAAIGFEQPDFILLTHIHIDHAGGVCAIADAFPQSPVVCHPKAIPHLIDPDRLWQGTLKTLGDLALAYGPIAPVSPAQVIATSDLKSSDIACIETPGHAVHHISYAVHDLLFAGEAGGVCLPLAHDAYYLRPATPPRFFLNTYLESLDRLLSRSPRYICYGHVGMRPNATHLLRAHRDQSRQCSN